MGSVQAWGIRKKRETFDTCIGEMMRTHKKTLELGIPQNWTKPFEQSTQPSVIPGSGSEGDSQFMDDVPHKIYIYPLVI